MQPDSWKASDVQHAVSIGSAWCCPTVQRGSLLASMGGMSPGLGVLSLPCARVPKHAAQAAGREHP